MNQPDSLELVETPLTCQELRRRWIKAFCPTLSQSLKSADYKPVLWVVFSSGRTPCLHGEEARRAFDRQQKGKLLAFYEYDGDEENALMMADASRLQSGALLDENDVYLMDEGAAWTYVSTHEDGYGPYFCRAQPSSEAQPRA
ncbi:MAG: DUF4275 family protein [Clostridiales bacterium]|jgi:hypothetical protein|nr:DUF4275 family protein [Clostridiales bacterium]